LFDLISSERDLNGLRSDNGLSGIPMKDLRRIYFFGDFEVGIWLMDICDETYLLENSPEHRNGINYSA